MVVVAAGRAANGFEVFSTISRTIKRDVGRVNYVRVLRIAAHFSEIPPAAKNARVGAYQRPLVAAIIGAIESAGGLGIDEGVDAFAVLSGNHIDADSPELARRQTVTGNLLPGNTAVF